MNRSSLPVILGHNKRRRFDGEIGEGLRVVARCDGGFGRKSGLIEDRVAIARNLLAVIDGIGGRPDGDKAAQAVARELVDDPEHVDEALVRAQERMRAIGTGLGAAISVAAFRPDASGMRLCTWHAGDVKRVHQRSRNLLHRLFRMPRYVESEDHSLAWLMAKEGKIPPSEIAAHPERRALVNWMDAEHLDGERQESELRPGERVYLYSDGISSYVDTGLLVRAARQLTLDELAGEVWRATGKSKGFKGSHDHRSFAAAEYRG